MKSILMVCTGNICRSPMAEKYFDKYANSSKVTISSAGIAALVGHPIDSTAKSVMQKNNIDTSLHRARQLTEAMCKQSELVFVMTKDQLVHLTNRFPLVTGRVYLLGHWQQEEILDPFQKDIQAFEVVFQQIKLAWNRWRERI